MNSIDSTQLQALQDAGPRLVRTIEGVLAQFRSGAEGLARVMADADLSAKALRQTAERVLGTDGEIAVALRRFVDDVATSDQAARRFRESMARSSEDVGDRLRQFEEHWNGLVALCASNLSIGSDHHAPDDHR